MGGWLDRQPTWLRDAIVGGSAVLAGWVVTDLVPTLPGGGAWVIVGPALVVGAGAVATWTRAYGRGSVKGGDE